MNTLADLLRAGDADARGPCSTDPDLWFSQDNEDIALAKRVCAACPLRDACLGVALQRKEREGVWGGLTPEERTPRSMRTAAAEARRVRRARPPLTIDSIRAHAEAGHTLDHTAFELQVHPSTVLGRLHKAGEEALTDALYANGGRARRPHRRKQRVSA